MEKTEIENIFLNISNGKKVSAGIDKIGIKSAKKAGLVDSYVNSVFNALNGNDYHFTKYKQLLKVKSEKKSPRVISIPCLRDRLLFKCIYENYLKSHLKRIKFEQTIHNICKDANNKMFDKVAIFDISSFFDSIEHDLLENALLNEGIDGHVIELIMKAIKVITINEFANKKEIKTINASISKGVPQGIIISNALAEIYAQQIDDFFIAEQKIKRISYHRFVDDILIFYDSSCLSEKTIESMVLSSLAKYKLSAQKDKVKIGLDIDHGFTFLGFAFGRGTISVRDDIVHKKEKKIERVIFDFKNSKHKKIINNYDYLIWKLNLEITGFVAGSLFYGWTSSYRFINDYSIFNKLDSTLKSLYKRAKLDPSRFNEIKSFVIAHNKINKIHRKTSNYIMNFDTEYQTVTDKKRLLVKLYGINSKSSDEYVNDLFDDIVRNEIFEVERDLDLKYGI